MNLSSTSAAVSASACAQLLDVEEQLRQARFRRNEVERSLQEAITTLRLTHPPIGELFDIKQSRVRELEKKLALETVRCEELQLELTTLQKNRLTQQQQQQQHQFNMANVGIGLGLSGVGGSAAATATNWSSVNKQCDIDKIVAKIEQDNRILADLEHNRPNATALTSTFHAPKDAYSSALSTYTHQQPIITCQSLYSTLTTTSYISSAYNSSIVPSLTSHMQQSHVQLPSYLIPQMGATMYSSSFTNPLLARLPLVPTTSISSALLPLNSSQYYNALYTTTGMGGVTGQVGNSVTFSNPIATHFKTHLPSVKPLTYENMDLMLSGASGLRRAQTPGTPHLSSWTLSAGAAPGVNSGLNDMRSLSRVLTDHELLVMENEQNQLLNGYPDDEVDLLDLPGRGKFPVYVSKLSYEPDPDMVYEELKLNAGEYVLVWNELPGPIVYFDAETVDGRRGLVPAHYMQRIVGEDLQNFRQSVMNLLADDDNNYLYGVNSDVVIPSDLQRLSDIQELNEIDADQEEICEVEPADFLLSMLVPAPRMLILERQLNKSVLISWTHPESNTGNPIESYHVYVDGVLKTTIKASERTRALIEGVDSNKSHRISVRSVTVNRRTSKDAACTMVIGKDTQYLGPSMVKASHITSTQAVITWLPANSNHHHIVCVNNVEVRTVKPGVFRHVITGLTPNTNYRVAVKPRLQSTVKPKAVQVVDEPSPVVTPLTAIAYTDFKTLPKGLPDPPSNVNVEPGPQDGTILVTWNPVQRALQHSNSIIGYSVYADGKKVTDIESPTGDHALVDIGKLLGLNPRHITVRTKSRDGHSLDSNPLPIPFSVFKGGASRSKQQVHAAMLPQVPQTTMNPNQPLYAAHHQQQVIIEPEENLSDKEVYPNSNTAFMLRSDPNKPNIDEEDFLGDGGAAVGRRNLNRSMNNNRYQRSTPTQKQLYSGQLSKPQQQLQPQQQYLQPQPVRGSGRMQGQLQMQKRQRWFVALYDYNPSTMSSDPEACDEELRFNEGDRIKVWGDKDVDGMYWGELRGRRGYIPHNMVMEIDSGVIDQSQQPRDKYAKIPLRKMVALYDYDPQELSPNVDTEAELNFAAGTIINVYGDIDEAGFYEGEINGVRGLVPSNFLSEVTDEYGGQVLISSTPGGSSSKHLQSRPINRYQGPTSSNLAPGTGPGARGPPPPPRDNLAMPTSIGMNNRSMRKTDACPVVQSFDTSTTTTSTTTTSNKLNTISNTQQYSSNNFDYNTYQQAQNMTTMSASSVQAQYNPQAQATTLVQPQGMGVVGNSNANYYGTVGYNQQLPQVARYKGAPNMQPQQQQQSNYMSPFQAQQQKQQQQQQQQPPNLMQKFSEMTTPGGDILSKGKELIFMKFGLGNNTTTTATTTPAPTSSLVGGMLNK